MHALPDTLILPPFSLPLSAWAPFSLALDLGPTRKRREGVASVAVKHALASDLVRILGHSGKVSALVRQTRAIPGEETAAVGFFQAVDDVEQALGRIIRCEKLSWRHTAFEWRG